MINLMNEEQYFLKASGMHGALVSDMGGDASFRRYKRVVKDDFSAVLAIYPFSEMHCFNNFIKLSSYLIDNGFSAPRVIAHDYCAGLMLIEDFGEETFTKILSPENMALLYTSSIDVLVRLHSLPLKEDLEVYSTERMIKELEIFLEYYSFYRNKVITSSDREDFFAITGHVLSEVRIRNDSLCLRDFHSPNLMYLRDRQNVRQIGIIDFQDAMVASKVYDVVSLLNDARIMISDTLSDMLASRYLNAMNIENHREFYDHFDIIAMQRNLRILGVFARQKLKYNNSSYESLMLIVSFYLRNNLNNVNLIELNKWLKKLNII